MASLETLLSSVRSETPISFFLVVSKVAFLGLELVAPWLREPPACAFWAAFFFPRFVIA